jgi:hypothetical protein
VNGLILKYGCQSGRGQVRTLNVGNGKWRDVLGMQSVPTLDEMSESLQLLGRPRVENFRRPLLGVGVQVQLVIDHPNPLQGNALRQWRIRSLGLQLHIFVLWSDIRDG